jgi:2-isopropylmalate synthase
MTKVHIYDTTLRDGTQSEGVSLSLQDKLHIARLLDGLGVSYIEGGWPGSNPKDAEFFHEIEKAPLATSTVVAFGSTRRASSPVARDPNLEALLNANTAAVALVGKSWSLHVTDVLGTTFDENLAMIRDSVGWMKDHGKEVIYDAEHFFDGYRSDPDYALQTVRTAAEAGADWIVLCDTNGGSLSTWVSRVVRTVREAISSPLGIHAHNDSELAVANALAAVEEGCTQIQGTINGNGERCGNTNLVSVIPALQLKMNRECVSEEGLSRLTELARAVGRVVNRAPSPFAPYVGESAFAHKGGIHVAAVEKIAASYEHIPPERVGNRRRVVVSELSGRSNVRVRAAELGLTTNGNEAAILARIKEREARGAQFEVAEGSFELLIRRSDPAYEPPFALVDVRVVITGGLDRGMGSEATVVLRAGDETLSDSAKGVGPVEAVERAIWKALVPRYPELEEVRVVDHKILVLDPDRSAGARTRVILSASDGREAWHTVACSANVVEASCQAVMESFELAVARAFGSEASRRGRAHNGMGS